MSPAVEIVNIIKTAIEAAGFDSVYAHDSSDIQSAEQISVQLTSSTRVNGLPGIYDVTGVVEYKCNPQDKTAAERRTAIGDLFDLIADVDAMESAIGATLRCYIYKFTGEDIIEDQTFYRYQLSFESRISLIPT